MSTKARGKQVKPLTLDFFFATKEVAREEKEEEEKKKEPSEARVLMELIDQRTKELLELAKKNRKIEEGENLLLISVEYEPTENKALMKFYDPLQSKIYLLYDKTGHKPYMLTDLSEEEIRQFSSRMRGTIEAIEKVERYDLINDKSVEMNKVVVSDPLAVGGPGGLRNLIGEEHSWEAWIQYHLNYIYDAQLWPGGIYDVKDGKPVLRIEETEEEEELRKIVEEDSLELAKRYLPVLTAPIPYIDFLALDIEVATEEAKLPDMKEPRQPVIAVGLTEVKFRNGKKEMSGEIWLLKGFNEKGSSFSEIKILGSDRGYEYGELEVNGKKIKVRLYESEKLMLLDLFEKLWEVPLLVTFNGDNFDLRYLEKRARFLGIPAEMIPFKVISKGEVKEAHLKVGVHIDLYRFYANPAIKAYAFANKYDTVSLDELSRTILGKEKLLHGIESFGSLELVELAKYCWWDSYLTAELFAYNDMTPYKLLITLSRLTHFPIRELSRRGVSAWIENWFYYEHRRRNYLIPNRKQLDEKEERVSKFGTRPQPVISGKKYRGAIVFEPKPGVWFNVWVLDFASIYPTIIKVHNISYETVNCPHPECVDNRVPETPHWVCKKRRGLASLLVGFVRDIRVRYFKKLAKTEKDPMKRAQYDIIQGALKVLVNASYGVFGAEHFPLYSLSTAEAITAYGREKIRRVAEKAKELGLEVVYGDTDSIFVHNPPKEKIEELIKWCEKELKVDLEVDKIYKYVAFSERKKNYFGVFPDGNVDIKGLMAKKRNTPEFLKKEFRKVLDILREVKDEKDIEVAKRKIAEVIAEILNKLRRKEYEVEELAIKVQLTKPISEYKKVTPPHVRAAKKMRRPPEPGSIIAYVKTKTDVAPVEKGVKISKEEIDWEKYMEYTRSVFEQLLDALGMSFSEIEAKSRGVMDLSAIIGSG